MSKYKDISELSMKSAVLMEPQTNKDVSPDVHGLDSIRQLFHTALILQRSQHDDGGFSRSWGVLLQSLCFYVRC